MPKYVLDENGNLRPKEEQEIINKVEEEIAQPENKSLEDIYNQFKISNLAADELSDHFVNPDDNSVESGFDLTKATDLINEREKLRLATEDVIRQDPTLYGGLKEAILEGGKKAGFSLLDGLSRTLNFFTAREAGLARGIIKQMRGEGTVLDGLREGVKDNIGFAEVLRDAGVPEGPELFKLFGFSFTARGAAGLSLDILLDPITYLSFGATAPSKVAVKQGSKSILRFAGKTLMTDKQLLKGIIAMKTTKAGQATLRALDSFAAVQISKNKTLRHLGQEVSQAFVPGFGQNKSTFNFLRKVERQILKGREDNAKLFQTIFKGISDEDKFLYFAAKNSTMKSESAFREGLVKAGLKGDTFIRESAKFGRRIFPHNPQLQQIDNILFDPKDGILTQMARKAGIPEEIMYQNYMHSTFKDLAKRMTKKKASKIGFKRFMALPAKQKKRFIQENLIKDPVVSLNEIADELFIVGQVNHAIKTIVRGFGEKFPGKREALKAGFKEFMPEGTLKFFRKTIPETEKTILGVAKKKPSFIPEDVLKAVQDFSDRNTISTPAALALYDSFTQQFKAFVTAVWPAFHFRNAMSNRVLRFINEGWKSFKLGDDLDAVKIMSNAADLDTRFIKYGKQNISLRTLKEWAKRDGVTETSQFWLDIGGGALDATPSKEISGRLASFFHPIATKNKFVRAGRRMGMAIEDEAKLASYVRALKDGYSRSEAAQISFQGLFDYGNLTKFERTVMRRIFPFYTFTRKNTELQLRTLLHNPGRQATMFKAIKDLQTEALKDLTDEELEAFNELKPEFLRSSFAIPAGQDKEGRIMWMTGFGWPQEDALEFFSSQGMWFRLHPLLKATAEQALNIDIGRSLSSTKAMGLKDTYEAKELQFLFTEVFKDAPSQEKVKQFVNDPNGFFQHPMTKLLGLKVAKKPKFEGGKVVGEEYVFHANPRALNAVRNTFIARMLTTMKQFGDPNLEDVHLLTRFMTGISIFKQDMDSTAAFEKAASTEAVADVLKRAGTEGGYMFRRTAAAKSAPRELKRLIKKINKR